MWFFKSDSKTSMHFIIYLRLALNNERPLPVSACVFSCIAWHTLQWLWCLSLSHIIWCSFPHHWYPTQCLKLFVLFIYDCYFSYLSLVHSVFPLITCNPPLNEHDTRLGKSVVLTHSPGLHVPLVINVFKLGCHLTCRHSSNRDACMHVIFNGTSFGRSATN